VQIEFGFDGNSDGLIGRLIRHFFPLAAGPHPRRVLTVTPRAGFSVRGAVWPQALASALLTPTQ
jgi:hypothetical protein